MALALLSMYFELLYPLFMKNGGLQKRHQPAESTFRRLKLNSLGLILLLVVVDVALASYHVGLDSLLQNKTSDLSQSPLVGSFPNQTTHSTIFRNRLPRYQGRAMTLNPTVRNQRELALRFSHRFALRAAEEICHLLVSLHGQLVACRLEEIGAHVLARCTILHLRVRGELGSKAE